MALVTVTYRPGAEYSPRHISQLLDCYRKWLERRGHVLRSVWVAELQQRGAVHYHIILALPYGLTPPKPDKQGWWPHGMSNVKWATKASGYVAKYASKASPDFKFPKGARLYGVGGTGHLRPQFRHYMRPRWQRRQFTQDDTLRRLPGGWWLHVQTGELFQSPYELADHCSQWSWTQFRLRAPPPVPTTGQPVGDGRTD
jgi:hypothetical protein